MLSLLALFAGFASSAAPSPPPPPAAATASAPARHGSARTGTTLAPDTEARWVPFTMTPGNQIRFTLTVNGKPASALLDTGVSYTVASRDFAAAAGLKRAIPGQADAIGGSVDIDWAATRTLSLGGLTRHGGRVAVVDLKPIATGGTDPIDLLVGADILSCCALDIDYDARRFRLLRSGRLPFRGATAPLSLLPGSNVYVSAMTLGAARLKPMIVDTGDGSAVTTTRSGWAMSGIKAARTTSTIAFGLGGQIETRVTIVPSLQAGSLTARQVEVRIEDDDGFSQRTGTMGRIGSGFLSRYRVLLDPGADRMVFQRGATADLAPRRSTSGLLVGYDNARFRVLHVMSNSPAAAAGWHAGDLICAVDGRPVGKPASAADADWAAGDPGRIVNLKMCDGDQRTLKLANFY